MNYNCPYCKSTKTQSRGHGSHYCANCQRWSYEEKSPAKVLLFDIETLPGKKYFWSLGEQDWNIESIIEDWCILSYSAKWLFEPKAFGTILTPKEAKAKDDKRIVKEIFNLFEKADVIIAHNGKGFDIPKVNYRFLINDIRPPSPYQIVDTKVSAQYAFSSTSNKLDWLAQQLKVGKKKHTDYSLWVKCGEGDKGALDYMYDYNKNDVFVLEDVYVKLRPWIRHPNMSLYLDLAEDEHVCPHCASDDIDWGLYYRTQARVYQAFRCNHCGAIGRHARRHISANSVRATK